MSKISLKYLPWLALAGLLLAGVSLALGIRSRAQMLSEDPETRSSTLSTLSAVAALQPGSIDDSAFLQDVRESLEAPYIATVWLFAPDGERVLFKEGSTANATAPSGEMEKILAALPQDALQSDQSAMLRAVAAMRIEGEHNDIYNHLLLPVNNPQGELIGFLGAAYEVSRSISGYVDVGFMAGIIALIAGLALYWLSLPVRVLLDARSRQERAWAWFVFVLLGNLVALAAYLIIRRSPVLPS